jgi:hypothetical protein
VRLGHGDNAHRVFPAPHSLTPSHRFLHSSQPGREAWEVHSLLIYKKMQGY